MEDIILIIDRRLKAIKLRMNEYQFDCLSGTKINMRYLRQLQSEINFLEEFKNLIIEENKK